MNFCTIIPPTTSVFGYLYYWDGEKSEPFVALVWGGGGWAALRHCEHQADGWRTGWWGSRLRWMWGNVGKPRWFHSKPGNSWDLEWEIMIGTGIYWGSKSIPKPIYTLGSRFRTNVNRGCPRTKIIRPASYPHISAICLGLMPGFPATWRTQEFAVFIDTFFKWIIFPVEFGNFHLFRYQTQATSPLEPRYVRHSRLCAEEVWTPKALQGLRGDFCALPWFFRLEFSPHS